MVFGYKNYFVRVLLLGGTAVFWGTHGPGGHAPSLADLFVFVVKEKGRRDWKSVTWLGKIRGR
jgi:hypothetical protein